MSFLSKEARVKRWRASGGLKMAHPYNIHKVRRVKKFSCEAWAWIGSELSFFFFCPKNRARGRGRIQWWEENFEPADFTARDSWGRGEMLKKKTFSKQVYGARKAWVRKEEGLQLTEQSKRASFSKAHIMKNRKKVEDRTARAWKQRRFHTDRFLYREAGISLSLRGHEVVSSSISRL